ncbi:MAG: indolepyruvate ferredoxin oxidoreductase subunit alpha [Candidatus Baldrarchaeia archaeon]
MSMEEFIEEILVDEPGKKVILSGNEAIVRGAIEAGVSFVTTYPGTPASEIGDIFSHICRKISGLYFEYSTNEIVAIETAVGAAWTGARALVAMKHVGLNVAADAFFTICYSGPNPGALVIAHGSDPGCYSSQNEQDNRYYALHAHCPLVQPSNPQECKDFTIAAFEMSEKLDLPVILDANMRTLHGLGEVTYGPINPPREGKRFVRSQFKYVNAGFVALSNKKRLLDRFRKAEEYAEKSDLNRVFEGGSSTGIITAGGAFNYVMEALDSLGLYDLPVLKLGIVHPIPRGLIKRFSENLERIIVVEELEGFIESDVKRIAFELGLDVEIVGKEYFPAYGELNVDLVVQGLSKVLGVKPKKNYDEIRKLATEVKSKYIPRDPIFCPGCPHRATLYAIKKVVGDNAIFGGDIGCYTLAALPPFNMTDFVICMGAGLSIAAGISHIIKDKPIIAFIGDSTFLHAGIPGLINAVYNNANLILVILDNRWVAMTGHQPTPATGISSTHEPTSPAVKLEEIVRACGVRFVKVFDPYNVRSAMEAISEALEHEGVRVLIARRECALQAERREKPRRLELQKRGIAAYYILEPERCQMCEECYKNFGCPAIKKSIIDGEEILYIETARCTHCDVCRQICKSGGPAIRKTIVNPHLLGV